MDSGRQASEIPKCIENNLGARLAVGGSAALANNIVDILSAMRLMHEQCGC